MDLQELKESNCIIFECISGSKAYGLATENSDDDIRGVFIMPRDQFYALILSRDNLIQMKKASGRPQDLVDVKALEEL